MGFGEYVFLGTVATYFAAILLTILWLLVTGEGDESGT